MWSELLYILLQVESKPFTDSQTWPSQRCGVERQWGVERISAKPDSCLPALPFFSKLTACSVTRIQALTLKPVRFLPMPSMQGRDSKLEPSCPPFWTCHPPLQYHWHCIYICHSGISDPCIRLTPSRPQCPHLHEALDQANLLRSWGAMRDLKCRFKSED